MITKIRRWAVQSNLRFFPFHAVSLLVAFVKTLCSRQLLDDARTELAAIEGIKTRVRTGEGALPAYPPEFRAAISKLTDEQLQDWLEAFRVMQAVDMVPAFLWGYAAAALTEHEARRGEDETFQASFPPVPPPTRRRSEVNECG